MRNIKLYNMVVRSSFLDGNKYYPQVFFRWMLVWIINDGGKGKIVIQII